MNQETDRAAIRLQRAVTRLSRVRDQHGYYSLHRDVERARVALDAAREAYLQLAPPSPIIPDGGLRP